MSFKSLLSIRTLKSSPASRAKYASEKKGSFTIFFLEFLNCKFYLLVVWIWFCESIDIFYPSEMVSITLYIYIYLKNIKKFGMYSIYNYTLYNIKRFICFLVARCFDWRHDSKVRDKSFFVLLFFGGGTSSSINLFFFFARTNAKFFSFRLLFNSLLLYFVTNGSSSSEASKAIIFTAQSYIFEKINK